MFVVRETSQGVRRTDVVVQTVDRATGDDITKIILKVLRHHEVAGRVIP